MSYGFCGIVRVVWRFICSCGRRIVLGLLVKARVSSKRMLRGYDIYCLIFVGFYVEEDRRRKKNVVAGLSLE